MSVYGTCYSLFETYADVSTPFCGLGDTDATPDCIQLQGLRRAGCGLLIEQGTQYTLLSGSSKGNRKALSWETKLVDIVPDWQLMDPIASAQAILVDLLSHMTGLPRHDDFYP